ncbi:tRNA(Ile)-lysidine synthase [Rhizobium sp. NFR07]|uniref:tRNA lysidine(34) synthetase TilS n=1 Tax=Rhizobium sp. NFR07 TaxID=1566262 RepID=UPI0008E83EAE|nr:tRNA lysidine(34) synthetase TilS [Rhizobium sp. NFR07]SFB53064.1 tRNA(Ile)-lysidine synthase [Rhizobium sp. NFR07]
MPGDLPQFPTLPEAVDEFLSSLLRPTTLLVAVSGGSDSAGLLIALHRALSSGTDSKHRLVAATVDHGLRPEAAAEAEAVARLCDELSIPHRILRWQGEKPKSGISAAAREARYRLLREAAELFGADAIVTGHTFDDQAETIAMRAARSADDGNLGLAGMAEAVLLDRRWWLLRPLLRTRREAIRDFLREQGRGWIDDPSNVDRHYERVRVRGSLRDEATLSPEAIREAGLRRSRLAAEAAGLARRYLQVHCGVLAHLDPHVLGEEVMAVRHLLGTLAAILGGRAHIPAAGTMDRVMAMLSGGHAFGGRPDRITAGRVIFDLRRQGLFIHREARDVPSTHVQPGGRIIWDGRFRIQNRSGNDLIVGPAPPDREMAHAMFENVPPAIAMRAMGAIFHLEVASRLAGTIDKASVITAPVLAPYDCFLPQFDLILGRELGVLFGCDEFPAAPIKVFGRKS